MIHLSKKIDLLNNINTLLNNYYRMMYNTEFKVKYYDIKDELIWKLKNKTTEELQDNSDLEYEYSNTDILLICDKLYRDELASVFYAENIMDDKIDIGMRYVLEKMINNNDFKDIIDKIKQICFVDESGCLSDAEQLYFNQNSDFMVMLTLFQKDYFYIFHKCICQQLTQGTIDNELLVEFKKITFDSLQVNYVL